jgi:hypothetical protein
VYERWSSFVDILPGESLPLKRSESKLQGRANYESSREYHNQGDCTMKRFRRWTDFAILSSLWISFPLLTYSQWIPQSLPSGYYPLAVEFADRNVGVSVGY